MPIRADAVRVYPVYEYTGAHGPDALISLWTTIEAAIAEARRLSDLYHPRIFELGQSMVLDEPNDDGERLN